MCDYNLQTVRSRPAKVGDKLDHDSTMKLLKTLKVSVGHDSRAAVPGAGDVNHVEVVFFDDPVQMHVNEILPRVVPQCPTSIRFTSASVSGRFSSETAAANDDRDGGTGCAPSSGRNH